MSSAGEFGCLCSHRGILVEAIKQNLDVVVVFEDDFKILSNQFSFLLHASINKIPENSVIYLDAHGSGLGDIKRDQNIPNLLIQLPKIPKLIFGTYALVFDIKAAKSIIQSIETDRQIDNTITKLIMKKKIKGFLLNKKTITYSEELGSNIKEMGRSH
jgi:GR25 family glycosyltransferase involved in LPS biosynthesis